MEITIIRFAYGSDATLGYLYAGHLKLATLEEPWLADPHGPGGQRRELGKRESCVPDGSYLLRPHISVRYPTGVYALVNPDIGVYYQPGEIPLGQVWGRSTILIHSGNTTEDIQGCILVGMRHERIGHAPGVVQSRVALDQVRGLLGRDLHRLIIRPIAGTQEAA